jgi:GNAT superfamily N-acetyltransferase
VIREARADEAGILAVIQREASVAALAHIFPPEEYPYPTSEVRQRWEEALGNPELTVVIREEDGDPVGCAGYRADWLDGLYVVPGLWGKGVGAELHDHVLGELRARGSAHCALWVLEQNHRARRFYERRGWRENGTSRVVPFPPNPIDVGYSIELG